MNSERRLLTLLIATSPLWAAGVGAQLMPPILSVEPNGFVPAIGPVGFASIDALGQNGTPGGGNAVPIIVGTKSELEAAVSSNLPKVVHFFGEISGGGAVDIGSNTTLLGIGAAKISGFTLVMGESPPAVQNIILRNFTVDNQSGSDAISCESNVGPLGTHHIWLDHLTLIGPVGDGAFDFTQGSTYATVSWCRFIGCDKTMLSGRSGFEAPGTGRMTIHHTWFEGCRQRQPFIQQFGWVHAFNNYYDIDPGFFSRTIDIANESHAYVENNHFEDCPSSVRARDSSNKVRDGGGNIFENSAPFSEQDAAACFVPSDFYSYTPDPSDTVKASVTAGAGTGNI